MVKKSMAKTIIDVAKVLQNQYKNLIVVVGSDRVKEFETLLKKYNGKDYNFDSIEIVSAGARDPDADGVDGMSASKMRASAADDDLGTFTRGLPSKLKSQAKQIFNKVRQGMDLDEQLDEAVLSRTQRRKRALTMRKYKGKIENFIRDIFTSITFIYIVIKICMYDFTFFSLKNIHVP